jgi:hypothetical protein
LTVALVTGLFMKMRIVLSSVLLTWKFQRAL